MGVDGQDEGERTGFSPARSGFVGHVEERYYHSAIFSLLIDGKLIVGHSMNTYSGV